MGARSRVHPHRKDAKPRASEDERRASGRRRLAGAEAAMWLQTALTASRGGGSFVGIGQHALTPSGWLPAATGDDIGAEASAVLGVGRPESLTVRYVELSHDVYQGGGVRNAPFCGILSISSSFLEEQFRRQLKRIMELDELVKKKEVAAMAFDADKATIMREMGELKSQDDGGGQKELHVSMSQLQSSCDELNANLSLLNDEKNSVQKALDDEKAEGCPKGHLPS
ncbi:hypothetical protein GUJ93_ZPchr0010g10683 [Zizania palustris]|uniref:Uncharacterized protein n=1 Tax=Zizania palustris TaxID=103762 RepID=A0A8J5WAL5_ZIZPA|nr:hypothetical protein GUJ93_ZPchr0010g10683 [Zizania palustris]